MSGRDLALTTLWKSFASSRVNNSMYSPSKWGIGYLNSPLVAAGVGGGRVSEEDSCSGGAGGLGIDDLVGIDDLELDLSFLARGGRALLPDELSLQLLLEEV